MEITAPQARRPRTRGLRSDAFETLLIHLDTDRERAGERYEVIRYRLLRFFTCRGSARPDELADETIDRVSRKLAAGETIRVPEIERYFLGVARNVLREAWDEESRRNATGLGAEADRPAPSPEPEAAIVVCLERCLEALPPESRDLLLRYYAADGAAKAETRKAIARGLGVGATALRLRLLRLRAKLERCIRLCLDGSETSPPREPSSSETKGNPLG